MVYEDGDTCEEETRKVVSEFECDERVEGDLVRVEEVRVCEYLVRWRTKYACNIMKRNELL